MKFLVSIKTAGRGSYILGHIEAEDRMSAQNTIADLLVEAGIPIDKIGKQVTDNTTLHVDIHTITIVPLKEFSSEQARGLTALL